MLPISGSKVVDLFLATLTIAEIYFLFKCVQLLSLLARALWQNYVPDSP